MMRGLSAPWRRRNNSSNNNNNNNNNKDAALHSPPKTATLKPTTAKPAAARGAGRSRASRASRRSDTNSTEGTTDSDGTQSVRPAPTTSRSNRPTSRHRLSRRGPPPPPQPPPPSGHANGSKTLFPNKRDNKDRKEMSSNGRHRQGRSSPAPPPSSAISTSGRSRSAPSGSRRAGVAGRSFSKKRRDTDERIGPRRSEKMMGHPSSHRSRSVPPTSKQRMTAQREDERRMKEEEREEKEKQRRKLRRHVPSGQKQQSRDSSKRQQSDNKRREKADIADRGHKKSSGSNNRHDRPRSTKRPSSKQADKEEKRRRARSTAANYRSKRQTFKEHKDGEGGEEPQQRTSSKYLQRKEEEKRGQSARPARRNKKDEIGQRDDKDKRPRRKSTRDRHSSNRQDDRKSSSNRDLNNDRVRRARSEAPKRRNGRSSTKFASPRALLGDERQSSRSPSPAYRRRRARSAGPLLRLTRGDWSLESSRHDDDDGPLLLTDGRTVASRGTRATRMRSRSFSSAMLRDHSPLLLTDGREEEEYPPQQRRSDRRPSEEERDWLEEDERDRMRRRPSRHHNQDCRNTTRRHGGDNGRRHQNSRSDNDLRRSSSRGPPRGNSRGPPRRRSKSPNNNGRRTKSQGPGQSRGNRHHSERPKSQDRRTARRSKSRGDRRYRNSSPSAALKSFMSAAVSTSSQRERTKSQDRRPIPRRVPMGGPINEDHGQRRSISRQHRGDARRSPENRRHNSRSVPKRLSRSPPPTTNNSRHRGSQDARIAAPGTTARTDNNRGDRTAPRTNCTRGDRFRERKDGDEHSDPQLQHRHRQDTRQSSEPERQSTKVDSSERELYRTAPRPNTAMSDEFREVEDGNVRSDPQVQQRHRQAPRRASKSERQPIKVDSSERAPRPTNTNGDQFRDREDGNSYSDPQLQQRHMQAPRPASKPEGGSIKTDSSERELYRTAPSPNTTMTDEFRDREDDSMHSDPQLQQRHLQVPRPVMRPERESIKVDSSERELPAMDQTCESDGESSGLECSSDAGRCSVEESTIEAPPKEEPVDMGRVQRAISCMKKRQRQAAVKDKAASSRTNMSRVPDNRAMPSMAMPPRDPIVQSIDESRNFSQQDLITESINGDDAANLPPAPVTPGSSEQNGFSAQASPRSARKGVRLRNIPPPPPPPRWRQDTANDFDVKTPGPPPSPVEDSSFIQKTIDSADDDSSFGPEPINSATARMRGLTDVVNLIFSDRRGGGSGLYSGELDKWGRPHGHGKMKYSSGKRFEGGWSNGQPNEAEYAQQMNPPPVPVIAPQQYPGVAAPIYGGGMSVAPQQQAMMHPCAMGATPAMYGGYGGIPMNQMNYQGGAVMMGDQGGMPHPMQNRMNTQASMMGGQGGMPQPHPMLNRMNSQASMMGGLGVMPQPHPMLNRMNSQASMMGGLGVMPQPHPMLNRMNSQASMMGQQEMHSPGADP